MTSSISTTARFCGRSWSKLLTPQANPKAPRAKYGAHRAAMSQLAGEDPAVVEKEAAAVLAIETGLAQASFERVKMRDPRNRDHKMSVAELNALAPNVSFARFFAG